MMSVLLLVHLLLPEVHAVPLEAYLRNREGVQKFNQKSYYPAYQQFLKALEADPLNPELQMNLACTFELNEEFDKAEQSYKGALHFLANDSVQRFQALFNLGGVLGKEHKIAEALAAYQLALEMVPDSKEVKTNIELLWQQGGGQGEGESKDQKDKEGKDKSKPKEGDGKEQKNQEPQDNKEQKKQPKPFQSQDLTPQDVKKILDEIKNQEQAIRAQEYERNVKEAPRGKDW